jgi:hypothetical protein
MPVKLAHPDIDFLTAGSSEATEMSFDAGGIGAHEYVKNFPIGATWWRVMASFLKSKRKMIEISIFTQFNDNQFCSNLQ